MASREHYIASMVLSGVGDALGYKNMEWEYCKSGVQIHDELYTLGGLENITVELPGWPISDDSVMHLATAEGLTCGKSDTSEILLALATKYKECMKDMEGRKPGPTSIKGTDQLDPSQALGYRIPFNPTGTGCGAAMRAMCIGLRFPLIEDESDLIKYGVECGRMTHHHPTGFLGSVAAALFVALSVRRMPGNEWGKYLVDLLPSVWDYVKSTDYCVEENNAEWKYFGDKWMWYLKERGIQDGNKEPIFPEKYGVEERDKIYTTFSLDGWAGRSGHDAPMIAYDSILASKNSWHELCSRSMFHGGDSDSTGVIAAACFGALYGFEGVPECNFRNLEYKSRFEELAHKLYEMSHDSAK